MREARPVGGRSRADRVAHALRASEAIACLSLVSALLAPSASLASRPSPRAANARAASGPPRFVLFGWVSPPPESTTRARIDEMAELGLNLMLPPENDAGRPPDNHARLSHATASGLQCLVFDDRLAAAFGLGLETPAGSALLDSAAAAYRGSAAFLGWYLGDEPTPPWAPQRSVHEALRSRDPSHLTWNNLLGPASFATDSQWRSYMSGYLDSIPAAVLSSAHYDFLRTETRGRFFEFASGLRAVADAHGVPFWGIVQLVEHGPYRALTAGELRWQASHLLAYGARGIGYFTYWTPAPDTFWNFQSAIIARNGTRTPAYDVLRDFHARLRPAGETLADCAWISTQVTGDLPAGAEPFVADPFVRGTAGRVTLGRFLGPGGLMHLVVVNRNPVATQVVLLRLGRLDVDLLTQFGTWNRAQGLEDPDGVSVPLIIEPGGFALLRLSPSAPIPAGDGGGIQVAPNPARGVVSLRLATRPHPGTLEILDALGRGVWKRDLAESTFEYGWTGVDLDGRPVPPGRYLARWRGASGESTTSFVWLGR
ncbi:MAG: hypothetical protein HOP12_14605 [Candidatus Eisenbacteria bacterium]|uniref:Glycoside hydrolase family 42 N-terminal domain-containing protein n=1 Tax=Eiseniibacteriota bacterium TaxID=2212470 RepID=A0A849SJ14_UNCEI|nr:hypothetical protein [Candidatus Eisenbacteria bacterium]